MMIYQQTSRSRSRSFFVFLVLGTACIADVKSSRPPNIVLLLADNLGYEDVSWFSSNNNHNNTPYIDSLGRDGLTFTNWNSAAHLCSASRAAILTGLYPARTGIFPGVFHPDAGLGFQGDTLASYLKQSGGFATAAVGKWHLGHLPDFLPTAVGFEQWFGIPYHMSGGSVDDHTCVFDTHHQEWLPLYRNTTIVQQPVQVERLAEYYQQEAAGFIEASAHNNTPFFLYMAFSHVHQLCASATRPEPKVCQWAANPAATFADAVREMDSIVGAILHALAGAGVEDNTIVIFTSDNGPWVAEQSCSGLKGPFQAEWFRNTVPQSCTACPHDYSPDPTPDRPRRCVIKNGALDVDGVHCGEDTGLGSVWEANLRMPTLLRWPQQIGARAQTDVLASSLDIVPTLLSLTNSAAYNATAFDGIDLSSVLLGTITEDGKSLLDDRILFFWRDGFLRDLAPLGPPYGRFDVVAVKVGRFKAWFWTKSAHYNDDMEDYHDPPLLFDTLADPAEASPIQYSMNDDSVYPELIHRIRAAVAAHKASLADTMFPRTLQRDARHIPCVDPATNCRTDTAVRQNDMSTSA